MTPTTSRQVDEAGRARLLFRGSIYMALIPIALFFIACAFLFIICRAFNMEALATAGFIALLLGGIFARSYTAYWNAAIRGISSITSVSVIVIFFVIGMFSALMKASGLSAGFVWMADKLSLSGGPFVAFVFFACCVMATATGSSIGTMFTSFPIFYPAGLLLGCNPAFLAGAIVGGAVFGDNLAPISDTTIASASTQQFRDGRPADVGGVVRSRFMYSLVAALITLVLYAIVGGIGGEYRGAEIAEQARPESLLMLIPVIVMLVVSTRTRNIFAGIGVGLVLGIITGLAAGLFPASAIFQNIPDENRAAGFLIDGVGNMLGTVALVISVFGIMGVLTSAGMLELIVERILASRMGRTARGAELISVIGVALTTVIFGGVTSASILTFGPILNQVGARRGLHPYRRANLLDGIANSLPAIVPFMSVFVFIGVVMTGLSPLAVAGGTLYAFALSGVLIVAVLSGWKRRFEGAEGEELRQEPSAEQLAEWSQTAAPLDTDAALD